MAQETSTTDTDQKKLHPNSDQPSLIKYEEEKKEDKYRLIMCFRVLFQEQPHQ